MFLPIILFFSLILMNGMNIYMHAISTINIYEKDLADRYIADFETTVCLREVIETFLHDPNLSLNTPNFNENQSGDVRTLHTEFMPLIGDGGEINSRSCAVHIARDFETSSATSTNQDNLINIDVDISVLEPSPRSLYAKIIFKNMEIEQILMKI